MAQKETKSKALLHEEIANYFVSNYLNIFGKDLYVLKTKDRFHFFEVDDRHVCAHITKEELAANLTGIGPRLKFVQKDFALTFRNALDCVESLGPIVAQTMPGFTLAEWPKAIAFNDDPSFTTYRLDFDEPMAVPFMRQTTAPEWCDFQSRTTNFKAFAMWVWSLFVEKSDRSQYVWLFGDGDDGKSIAASVICDLFGDINNDQCAWTTAMPEHFANRFWFSGLVGKRLCYVAEGDGKMPISEKFKAITGDNTLLVERKGEQPYNAPMAVKFIFCSNQILEIDGSKANTRRVIYCTVSPFTGPIRDQYEIKAKMAEELPALLSYGRYLYEERGIQRIPTDTGEVDDIIMDSEQAAVNMFEFYFKKEPGEMCPANEVGAAFSRSNIPCKQRQHKIYQVWKKVYGIEKKTIRDDNGKIFKVYAGMKSTAN